MLSVTLSGSASISAGTNGTADVTIQGSEADINATLATLTYTGNTDVNGTAADTLTVTTNDQGNTGSGGAQQDVDTVQIDITAVNDAPTISNLSGDALAYTEGDGALVIEQGGDASVLDVDSADFDGGTLTVSFAAGSDAVEDVLAIRNVGTGVGQIGVSASNVTYEGTVIGTFAGGSGGSDLVITLNANADADAVSA